MTHFDSLKLLTPATAIAVLKHTEKGMFGNVAVVSSGVTADAPLQFRQSRKGLYNGVSSIDSVALRGFI